MSKLDNVSLQQIINRTPLFKNRYLSSFPSEDVPNLLNQIFAIKNTQPRNLQVEHWILIKNSRHKVFLQTLSVDPVSSSSSTERWCHHHYNFIPVFAVFTGYMQFLISSISEKKITGAYDVYVLSFSRKDMYCFIFFNINAQVIQCVCLFSCTLVNFWRL